MSRDHGSGVDLAVSDGQRHAPRTGAGATGAAEAIVEFARPSITDAEIGEVVATLRSGWLTTGPRVREFERRFAAYTGAPHAVAVSSCTAALHLALHACQIGAGDEVITTPLTFCATANAVIHAGATPVFADVDPSSMNLDPTAVRAALTPRTRALLPVHLAGLPAHVGALGALARQHGALLIEDAAHCIEGYAAGAKIGTTADLTCFSFYSTKNLTTGEGGMVTTASAEWARRIRVAASHGLSRDAWSREEHAGAGPYEVVAAGFKCNMMDLQAAIGLHQLARLDSLHARRCEIWRRYDAALAELPVSRPAESPAGDLHARHLYTILVDRERCGRSRDELQRDLASLGIPTSVHFRALHLHPYYARRFALERGMFPNAEFVSDRTLSLPLSATLSDAAVDRVIVALRAVIR